MDENSKKKASRNNVSEAYAGAVPAYCAADGQIYNFFINAKKNPGSTCAGSEPKPNNKPNKYLFPIFINAVEKHQHI